MSSVYGVDSAYLLNKTMRLIELHSSRKDLFGRIESNLDNRFLENTVFNFFRWWEELAHNFPTLDRIIVDSAQKTDNHIYY